MPRQAEKNIPLKQVLEIINKNTYFHFIVVAQNYLASSKFTAEPVFFGDMQILAGSQSIEDDGEQPPNQR
jgi:hypothetical protein